MHTPWSLCTFLSQCKNFIDYLKEAAVLKDVFKYIFEGQRTDYSDPMVSCLKNATVLTDIFKKLVPGEKWFQASLLRLKKAAVLTDVVINYFGG